MLQTKFGLGLFAALGFPSVWPTITRDGRLSDYPTRYADSVAYLVKKYLNVGSQLTLTDQVREHAREDVGSHLTLTDRVREHAHEDGGSQLALTDRVREHAHAYGTYTVWWAVIAYALTYVKYIVFAIALAWFPTLTGALPGIETPGFHELVINPRGFAFELTLILILPIFLTRFVLFVAVGPLPALSSLYAMRVTDKPLRRWFLVCFAFYTVWLAVLERRALIHELSANQVVLYRTLLLTVAIVAAIALVSAFSRLCNYLLAWSMSRHFADSLIVINLLVGLSILKTGSYSVHDERWRRRELIIILESIASSFEHWLPKQILGKDLSSSDLRLDLAKIGDGVRALKRPITIPTSTSWTEELFIDMSDFSLNFISLNWAGLPKAEIEKKPAPTIISRILGTIRFLLIAAIPAGLLAGLQAAHVPLATQHADIAWLVVAGWFAISLIIRIDPQYDEKAKALKDVRDLVTLKATKPE
jgi:hypothetical protein